MIDIYKALSEILADELNQASAPLTEHTELDDLPGWDSAALAGVILSIESHFGVSITRKQLDSIVTVADLARLCQAPLV